MRHVIRLLTVTLAFALGGLAAQAGAVIDATQRHCIDPLHTDVALGFGLERAPAEMEVKLLHGKQGRIFRTDNPQILVVAHDSGKTCEIMAIGTDISGFNAATAGWQLDGVAMTASEDSNVHLDKPGGGYYAGARASGGYIQIFVTSHPESRFLGLTVGRVEDSAHAREVLGIE